MKTFKLLIAALLVLTLSACASSEENEVMDESTSTTESETVATETPDIVESEDINNLGLDNALLELDLVE
jgi:uncharacterized lipoprotein